MREFQFQDEIRAWVIAARLQGEVWVRWVGRPFRLHKVRGYWLASDVASDATCLITKCSSKT